MALSNIIAKRREFTHVDAANGNQTISVGAIDLTIAVALFATRQDDIIRLFDEAAKTGLTKNPDPLKIGLMLLSLAPDFVAEVIAWAAGEPQAAPQAKSLPIGLQLEIIDAIFELTFEAEGGVKKFGETVVRLLGKANQTFAEVTTTSIQ